MCRLAARLEAGAATAAEQQLAERLVMMNNAGGTC